MSLSKKDLIRKLQAISALHKKAVSIQNKMNNFVLEDNYKRKINVPVFPGKYEDEDDREILESSVDHTDDDAIEQMGNAYDELYHPKKPEIPRKPVYSEPNVQGIKNKESKFGCLSYLAIGIAGFFALGSIVGVDESTADTRPVILTIAALGVVAFIVLKLLLKKLKAEKDKINAEARAKYDSEIAEIDAKYNAALKAYETECEAYRPVRQSFLDEYSSWRDIYLESVEEEEEISEKLEVERQAAVEKIKAEEFMPVFADLDELNDLVSMEYLFVLDDIIDLISSGRADDIKEAINLYEEIKYRERQLELEREKEEQRAREAELQRQDEERRHREDMRFRESQERQRRYEEKQRRSDEERRQREEKAEALRRESQERERIRREEYKDHMSRIERERKQRDAGQAQCRACINAGRCNMSIHNDAPTCAGFRPRT